jgi:D-alanine-D-alanine ligase-like ATP-grasp enzyme
MRHDENPPKGIRPVAIAAVEALGYDHGAVDLLVTGEPHHEAGIARNDIVILEVNLIPAMDRYTCIQYAKAVARKFGVTYVPITAED